MRQEFSLSTPLKAARMSLRAAADIVPAGRWGVAVSGGADSVATLRLLARRAREGPELLLTVIHLDHQLRGAESEADAHFVQELARELGLPVGLARRHDIEARVPELQVALGDEKRALSARMRQLRLELYRQAVSQHALQGVILGHHADDLAETLFMRLLRCSPRSGTLGLAPLRFQQTVGGVRLLRPMLRVRRRRLRRFLGRTHCPWREDASNASASQLRNRVRLLLSDRPGATSALLRLAECTAGVEEALAAITPEVAVSPRLTDLAGFAQPLLRRALRRWMVVRGVPQGAAGPRAVDSLLKMLDLAGPASLDLAGGLRVRRRGGRLVPAHRPTR